MNGRELLMICAFGSLFVVFLSWLATRHKRHHDERMRRFDVIVEALRDPGLDAATRAELLRAIARQHQGALGWIWARLQAPMLWKVLWFGAGWMTMLLSGAALATHALGMNMIRSYDLAPITMIAVVGFGMVTLPLALRELLRRERSPASR